MRPSVCSLTVAALLCLAAVRADAQAPVEPFEILDNSFLVEEAFNQPPRVFQNIFTWMRDEHGGWEAGFTQEWPFFGNRHQLSYTVPFGGIDGETDRGPVFLNYRYQLLEEGPGRPAFSPRISLVLPTGPRGTADDRTGLQVNLPFSKQRRDLYFHWNAGMTWISNVPRGGANPDEVSLTSPHLAGSIIWRIRPMFHLMLETVVAFDETVNEAVGTSRSEATTLSPGFRRGWNIGEHQLVIGVAMPATRNEGETTLAVLTYFSYELPF